MTIDEQHEPPQENQAENQAAPPEPAGTPNPESPSSGDTPASPQAKANPAGAQPFGTQPSGTQPPGPRGRGPRGGRKSRDNAPGTRLGAPGGGRGPASAAAESEARDDWKEKVIQIRRVTKVVKGGKKLSFRAVVVVGDGNGQVGIGIGKSNEVIGAIQKGVAAAKKSLIKVPIHKTTIPHPVKSKAGGSVVVLLPAAEGTGVIAGGAARALLELAGVGNILSKSLGSNSPLNVARATLKGLSELRTFDEIARTRGKTVREILM
jgi:small subunit ribosomal protein S5